jgi:hypothetical protein
MALITMGFQKRHDFPNERILSGIFLTFGGMAGNHEYHVSDDERFIIFQSVHVHISVFETPHSGQQVRTLMIPAKLSLRKLT